MITRVCRVVGDYPVRGEANYGLQPVFVNLSEQQVKQGYEVHVITSRGPYQPAEESCNGVRIHRVHVPFNLSALMEVRRRIGNGEEWVIHSHATCGMFLAPLRKIRQLRWVSHVHGTSRSHNVPLRYEGGHMAVSYSQLGITYDILREKLLWSTADRLLAVSQALRNDLVDSCGLDSNRIRIVYNGVDTEVFHPKPAPTSPLPLASLDKKIILYVGHFGLRKGLFFLIRAMKKVKKEVPDSHLICIGGVPKWLGKVDYWGILRNEVSLNDVEDSVTILDRVKQRELADYYVAARVFALPSYYESFPKAIVEAMACGLPVVATSSGGIPELVDDGVTGTLVPFGSVESLAKALVETLSDESHSRAMGLRGRQKVERMFTWKAVSERVKSAYEELDASDCRN